MAAPTDAALITAARTTPAGFEAAVRRHHIAIHRYVVRRPGPAEAGGVASEVFAAACAQPWLFGVATHMVRRQHRKEQSCCRPAHAPAPTPSRPTCPCTTAAFHGQWRRQVPAR